MDVGKSDALSRLKATVCDEFWPDEEHISPPEAISMKWTRICLPILLAATSIVGLPVEKESGCLEADKEPSSLPAEYLVAEMEFVKVKA